MFVKKFGDLITGLIFLGLSVAIFIASGFLEASLMGGLGADFMPRVLAVVTAVLAVIEIRQGVITIRNYNSGYAENEEQNDRLRVLLTILVFAGFVLLMQPLGFILSAVIYLFLQILILAPEDQRKAKHIVMYAVISVVVSIAVYYIFRYGLSVMLPTGILS